MKALIVALFVLGSLGPTPQFCAGAQMATVMAAQLQEPTNPERHTPAGEWCQRPPVQSNKAHACACHQTDCNDADPNHVPAHTDPKCLNYCTQSQCKCSVNDCP